VGAFRGARVAWAGIAAPPAARIDLQSRLATQLRAGGFELEDRVFVPHLTLARHIAAPLPRQAIAPIGWQVREVALMRSEAGTGRYTRLEAWELPG
jgi:2'-5' RNA ligase